SFFAMRSDHSSLSTNIRQWQFRIPGSIALRCGIQKQDAVAVRSSSFCVFCASFWLSSSLRKSAFIRGSLIYSSRASSAANGSAHFSRYVFRLRKHAQEISAEDLVYVLFTVTALQ